MTELVVEEGVETNGGSPFVIRLDNFEGPFDLLLHLIKENQVDIYNIPIAKLTADYLRTLDVMRELNLEVAGEFLVMAATLAHIKSQMLLPPTEDQSDPEEEGVDPRAELVRRLLEYQKYKDVAERLFARPLLYRDVFKRERELPLDLPKRDEPAELVEISIFKLVEAFHRVLDNFHPDEPHQVIGETIRIGDRVRFIVNAIRSSAEGTVNFEMLFVEERSRQAVVVTFLAILEMLKRGALRLYQEESFGEIHLIGTPLLYGGSWYDRKSDFEEPAQERA